MKHYVMLLGIALLSLGACKKDKKTESVKTFADYTQKDISDQLNNITSETITYDAPAGTNFKVGSIIFFKTNANNYGKMKVVSVSPQSDLVVDMVVFDANGGKLVNQTNKTFVLTLNVAYELDSALIPEELSQDADFAWGTAAGLKSLVFINGAKAYLYKL